MVRNSKVDTIRILYYGAGWPTNIGNAFIDLGAMAILHAAVPNAHVTFASEMPRWFFGPGAKRSQIQKSRRFHFWRGDQPVEEPIMDNALDIASVTQCDLVVFSGMAMCEVFVRVNGPTILSLSGRGVPVLLLGTGAQQYSQQEKNLYGDFLRRVRPIGFVSRDDRAYDMFADYVHQAQKGIDCGFFLSEAYTPFPLVLPAYLVAAFDSTPEPVLDLKGRQLIRAHHDCWTPLKREHTSTANTLISDIPYDYLALYANAEEVHSDRVHTCVAALAYGRHARLYHPTPRSSLFDAVGAIEIRDRLVQLDLQSLKRKKELQIEFARQIITEHVRGLNTF